MNRALGDIPVTVKLRTGVKDGKNTAHKLMPRVASEWGAACITVSSVAFRFEFYRNSRTNVLSYMDARVSSVTPD